MRDKQSCGEEGVGDLFFFVAVAVAVAGAVTVAVAVAATCYLAGKGGNVGCPFPPTNSDNIKEGSAHGMAHETIYEILGFRHKIHLTRAVILWNICMSGRKGNVIVFDNMYSFIFARFSRYCCAILEHYS